MRRVSARGAGTAKTIGAAGRTVMDDRQLQAFLVTIARGSVTRAATSLNMSQPALSQLILRLEDEIGVKLFRRMSRGIELTEEGRLFQEHAHNILVGIERAREDLGRFEKEIHGPVGLGLPSSISHLLGVPLLIAAQQHLPGVQLRLDDSMSGDIQRSIECCALDLAILYNAEHLDHLSTKRLAIEDLYLIGPRNGFGEEDEWGIALDRIAEQDLVDFPLILPSAQHSLRKLIEEQARARQIRLSIRLELNSLSHIRTMIAAGKGYSILSHAAIHIDSGDRRLGAARLAGEGFFRSVDLVRNPKSPITRSSLAVADLLLQTMRQMIGRQQWVVRTVLPALVAAS